MALRIDLNDVQTLKWWRKMRDHVPTTGNRAAKFTMGSRLHKIVCLSALLLSQRSYCRSEAF